MRAALLALLFASTLAIATPVPVLFDTDMDSDCDDAGALAMLHALADAGEARILATAISSANPWAPACTSALNTFYGRPQLPVGAPKHPGASAQASRFAQQVAAEFPHQETVEDATVVYRRVLASESDGSVVLLTVGDLTNVRYFLESPGDAISPLTGVEMAARKVRQWVCMGSRYPADLDPKQWGNFKMDPESTVRALARWPGRITFTGGGAFAEALATGGCLAELPKEHPVRRVYELYFGGTVRNRHSADLIATYIAVRGTGHPWALTRGGHNEIFPDGRHAWRAAPDDPRQEYISALAPGVPPAEVVAEFSRLLRHPPARKPLDTP